MKKSYKIIAVVAVLAVVMLLTLTGCSQTPYEKYLSTNWDSNKVERFTYDVEYKKDDTTLTGTLVTNIFKVNKDIKFTINETVYNNADNKVESGTYFEYTLTVDNNGYNDTVKAKVYFDAYNNQNFRPRHSFVSRDFKDLKETMELTYSNKSVNATIITNGVETTYSADLGKSMVYDNTQLYAIARSLYFGQNGQLGFKTPVVESSTIYPKTVAMGLTAKTKGNVKNSEGVVSDDTFIKVNSGDEFNAGIAIVTSNEKPAGLPTSLLVVDGTVTFNGGADKFTQPIIQITEGNGKVFSLNAIISNMEKIDFNEVDFN